MGTIRIENQSDLEDFIAVYRVFLFATGFREDACRPSRGGYKVNITKRGNTYTVTDAEEGER